MKILWFACCFLIFMAALIPPQVAEAGPYTDDLSKCMVQSTTANDRLGLVRWMFSAAATHPAVKSIVFVSEQQLDDANKTVAELFMKLLTVSCRQQTQRALKYEGIRALQSSGEVLGRIAGQELFSSPEVQAGMAGLDKYFDSEKLESLVAVE